MLDTPIERPIPPHLLGGPVALVISAAANWTTALLPADDDAFEQLGAGKISPGSWWSSNHPLACFFLHRLLPLARTVSLGLLPNHAVLRISERGHEVLAHRDTDPVTPTVALNVTVFQSYGPPWPFTAAGKTFAPRPGNVIIFSGRAHQHARPPLLCDRYVNIICYYRRADDHTDYALKRSPDDIKTLADFAAIRLRPAVAQSNNDC